MLAVDRYEKLRFSQSHQHFKLFLTGMSGNMDILENKLRPFHGQLIDDLGYCLFISRTRIGAHDDGIDWLDCNEFCVGFQADGELVSATGQRENKWECPFGRDDDSKFETIIDLSANNPYNSLHTDYNEEEY